jgi:hypothetical protein
MALIVGLTVATDFATEVVMLIFRRILMFPINLRRKYIAKGIEIRDFRAAASDTTRPHSIDIRFVIDSNTDATVRLKRVILCLYAGSWEVARLDLNPDLDDLPRLIKGRTNPEVGLCFYPPVLWWVEGRSALELKKAEFEVESAWGIIRWSVRITKGSATIDHVDKIRDSYIGIMRWVLREKESL